MKVKVISTDPGASLPAVDGQAEMLNSSLVKYSELTVCARFLTHHFSTRYDSPSEQIILSYGDNLLLGSYVTRPCDQYFQVEFPMGYCKIVFYLGKIREHFLIFCARVVLRPTKIL